jgi:hypothetical protein
MHNKLSQDSSKFKIRCTKLREQLPLSHINSKQDKKNDRVFSPFRVKVPKVGS